MKDDKKTKEQLIQELKDLRRKIAELEKTETGRKRAEEELRESEEKYRSLAFAEDPMYFVDRECRYQFMNKAHLLRLGLSLDKVIGRSYGEFHSEEDTRQFTDIVKAVFATGNSFQTEHRSERDNRYFLRTFSPVKDLQGSITDVTVISKDITERKRTEEALQESEKNYRNLFENANEAIFVAQEGKLVFLNPKTIIIIGYSAEELMSRPFIEFIHPDDRELVLDRHVRRMKGEEVPQAYDFRVMQKDSNIRWVELKVVGIHWKGRPATLNLLYDITERKQTEKLLLASEARLKAQYQGSPIATFTWQKRGDDFELVDYNQAAKVATKGEVIKFLGKTANEMYRGRQEILQDIHRCFTKKEIIKKELRSQDFMPGRTMVVTYVFDPPDLIMVYTDDITERNRIEEALRKSEEKYRSILETIEDGYYEVDLAGNLTFFNEALTRIHGYPREELMGRNNRQYTDEEDSQKMYRNFNQVYQTGQPSKGTYYEIITKNGVRKALETSVSLIRDSTGKPTGFRGIAREITELRQTQIALADSEERFRMVAESSNDFIFEWNLKSGQMEWFGKAIEKLKDLLSEIPQTITAYQKIVHPEDLDRLIAATKQNLKKQGSFLEEYRIIGKGGQTIYLRSAGTCLRNEKGKPHKWIGALSDITERIKGEEVLKTLSLRDDLTGLLNRRGFITMAEQGLKTAQRMGREMLLIFGDLDNLKGINDGFGHNEGDRALVDTSRILKETFRESDIIARIGGDEFVMLAMNTLETSGEKLINRFEQVLDDHHLQTKPPYKLAMSFGIAYFNPKNPSSIEVLLAEADKLMYENKQRKVDRVKNGPAFFRHTLIGNCWNLKL